MRRKLYISSFTQSPNAWLIVFFLITSGSIIIRSAHHPDGYLSSDSAHYLQMALNLMNGNGMETVNHVGGMSTYFATWPIGYPALIAVTSVISGLSVFWASKLVNIVLLGLCLFIIKRMFKQRAAVIGLLIFLSTITELFTYTWSEVPFLFGMLWLVYGLVRYIDYGKNYFLLQAMGAAFLLFFVRYIGLIGAGIIGLVGFYYFFRKEWKPMIKCWVAGGIPIIIAGIYLGINYHETGQFTGMERIPRIESPSEFFTMLWDAIKIEFNLLSVELETYVTGNIILLATAFLFFIRPRNLSALFQIQKRNFLLPGLFLSTGIIYFIGIVCLRWSAYFDTFNFRLLGPATFMLWLFILSWTTQVKFEKWIRWRSFFIIIFGVALLVNTGYSTYEAVTSNSPDYRQTVQMVTERYEQIPEGSIVALENIHARYIRPDLQYIKVHFRPYFAKKETIKEFKARITPNDASGIYLQVDSLFRYHKSFVKLMDKAEKNDKDFIELD